MIKKGNQRITITLTQGELMYLDLINSKSNKKTYTQAIKLLIHLFKLTNLSKEIEK